MPTGKALMSCVLAGALLWGVFLGIAATLYAIVFMKQKSEKDKLKSGITGISIFINFLIVDKEKAIQQGVEGIAIVEDLMHAQELKS